MTTDPSQKAPGSKNEAPVAEKEVTSISKEDHQTARGRQTVPVARKKGQKNARKGETTSKAR